MYFLEREGGLDPKICSSGKKSIPTPMGGGGRGLPYKGRVIIGNEKYKHCLTLIAFISDFNCLNCAKLSGGLVEKGKSYLHCK